MTATQYKEKILSYIEKEDKEYLAQVELLREHYENGRTILLQLKLTIANLTHEELGSYLSFLINFCKVACLFADEPVIKKFKSLGISEKTTRWFIQIEKIETRFNLIGNKKILILKNVALNSILHFLGSKIVPALNKDAKTILKTKAGSNVNLKNLIVNTFRRREYANTYSGNQTNPLKLIINEQATFFENEYKNRKMAKMTLIKLVEGKTEPFHLKIRLHSFLPTKEMEQTEFLSSIACIFKLISKDRVIWSEAQYEDRESSYENNYRRYLALRVKNLTDYDPKVDDFSNILIHTAWNTSSHFDVK